MTRTPKQVIADQKKQAERDRAQKPAQAIAVVKPALPANLDHRSPRERYLDECAPSGIVGRLVKFDGKDGKFIFADDDTAISESDDFVVLCDETFVSYVRFNGEGQPPTRHGGLLYQGFVLPPREELGDTDPRTWPIGHSGKPEDPWKHEQMIVLRRPTTLELLTFSAMNPTGRRAVGNLLKHYDRLQLATPGAFPVVRLKPSGYNDSRYGWVHTPLFVVVGMTSGPSDPTSIAGPPGSAGPSGYSAEVPDTTLKKEMNDRIPF